MQLRVRRVTGWSSLPPDVRAVAEQTLTRKQLDVLKLHLAGCGYKRISVMLQVGVPTVRGHLSAALHKLERAGVARDRSGRLFIDSKEAA